MRHIVILSLPALVACAKTTAPAEAPAEAPTEAAVEEAAPEEAAPAVQHFGEAFTLEEVTPAATLLAAPADFVEKTIRVEGRVTDVCQKAGCWMVITDETNHMRIRTKDHGFFVAKDGAGSTAQIEGLVVALEVDPDTVAHFESESSEGATIPEHSAKDNTTYEMVASSVEFRR